MRILLVEDEEAIAEPLIAGLRRQGYRVIWERSGKEAEEELVETPPDLLIVDVHLLDGEEAGFLLVQRAREMRLSAPILMLTARDAIEDRIRGLDVGADDYLPKPFAATELSARIRALLRRVQQVKENKLVRGELSIDFRSRTVRLQERTVSLTTREYALLELLARNPDRIFSSEEIIDRVWEERATNTSVVRVYVHYLRSKMGRDIIAKVSRGYRLGI